MALTQKVTRHDGKVFRVIADDKNPVLLCKTPSQLLLLALSDLRKVERDEHYKVNMGEWHKPNSHCSVCFAGAVMAKSMNLSRRVYAVPDDMDNSLLSDRLNSLDAIRTGQVHDFVRMFYRCAANPYPTEYPDIDKVYDEFPDGYVCVSSYPYPRGDEIYTKTEIRNFRKQWHDDIKDIAKRLRKIGF